MRVGRARIGEAAPVVLETDGQWYDVSKCRIADAPLRTIKSLLTAPSFLAAVPNGAEPIAPPEAFALPLNPGKIVAVGRNYRAHAEELNNPVPEEPVLFSKSPDTCIASGGSIEFGPAIGRVDHEGEIAVVVGCEIKRGGEVPPHAIFGYTLLNDVTARDLQSADKERKLPWFRSKNLDTFCPLGPVIRLAHDIAEPIEWDLEVRVNGDLRQSGNTRQFIFDIPTIIRYITRTMSLNPGDIIATGTPAGVAPIADGDIVEVHCPEIGTLVNPVVAKAD